MAAKYRPNLDRERVDHSSMIEFLKPIPAAGLGIICAQRQFTDEIFVEYRPGCLKSRPPFVQEMNGDRTSNY